MSASPSVIHCQLSFCAETVHFPAGQVFTGNTLPPGLQTKIHTMPGENISQVVNFPTGRPERPVCVINALGHVVKLCALLSLQVKQKAGQTTAVITISTDI